MRFAVALTALLLAAASSDAASTVLYQTGWEATPAYPGWVVGDVVPQNNWINQNVTAGHRVVANGSQGSITTPYGTQFHKFTASESHSAIIARLAWTDLTPAFTSRPAGQNVIKASMDFYVPSSQAGVPARYGVAAYHGGSLPWGVLVDPSDRSVNILLDDDVRDFTESAFAYDTWFNLAVTANYVTGEIRVDVNGVNLPELTKTSARIFTDGLTDVDLYAENYIPSAPTTRIAYSDNFRVTSETTAEPRPPLTIVPGAGGAWHLSWSATFSNWVLESTHDIQAATWTNENVTPTITGGVASVNLPQGPPRTFYRLRKP